MVVEAGPEYCSTTLFVSPPSLFQGATGPLRPVPKSSYFNRFFVPGCTATDLRPIPPKGMSLA
jgi:hypothetical protein